MGMTNEESLDGSLSRSGSSTGGDDYGDRNESFWPRFVHEINE